MRTLGLALVYGSVALAQGAPAAPQVGTPPSAAAPAAAPVITPPANTAPPTPKADGEFTIAAPYAPAPELTVKDGVPKGTVKEFVMDSKDSKIYPGIAKNQPGVVVPYQRRVAVYVPAQYVPGTPAPFIVVQDGTSPTYLNNLPPILDNMIHEKRLPAMIAVFVNHGGGDGQGSERGLEYDTVSGTYTTFIETEVLPKIAADYNITFTKDPEGRATMGGSSGAACAFTMAWFHPELYHRVLSYSGTFVNQQSPLNPESPNGAWEYHENLIPKNPAKPIRIWMHVSDRDNGATRDEASLHNWPLANQRMAAALKAKGYHYQYVFAQGAGHVDRAVVTQTLPEALEWLWQGYSQK
ncbi:MAG: alpha/beta hydrolase-fold protein [Acidobacteriota bacterium]